MIVTQSRGNFADLAGFTERTSSVCCVVDFIDSFFLSLLSRNLAMIPASVEDVIKTTSSNSNQSERERERECSTTSRLWRCSSQFCVL